jgi:hypothetical protein
MLDEPKPGSSLSAEAEQILSQMPVIEGAPGSAPVSTESGAEPLLALAGMVAFEEQDVKDTLEEFFAFLADRFDSEHWELTERQSRMLGKPTTLLLNSLWTKLQQLLPDVIARWCESTPGAMAFLTACGLVLVPKVIVQIRISRERRRAKRIIENPKPQPQPPAPAVPQPPVQNGVIYTEGRAA